MWVRQFLKHVSTIMSPTPEEVVWCYGEWQPVYDEMKDVTFVEGRVPVNAEMRVKWESNTHYRHDLGVI